MRIIITGGAGFIGSSFTHFMNKDIYQEQNFELLVIDKLTYAANRDNIPDNVELLQKDICDVTADDLGEYDYIVNFAAESHVDNSIKDGSPFVKTNIQGTFNLLELARKNPKLRKFIQISTDEVYGDLDIVGRVKSHETDGLFPSSYYSATKASADMLVYSCGHTFELPYLIIRMCNNFGERQHTEKFIPKLIDCIKNDKPMDIYGDGLQKREWIWVEDSILYIWRLINSPNTGIFNVGSGDIHTNLELTRLAQKSGLVDRTTVNFISDRKGHDRRYTLETQKAHNTLIIKPINKSIIDFLLENIKK